MPNIKTRINAIAGLRFADAEIRQVEFPGPVSASAVTELLQVLKDSNAEFALYDERYPSASDPGGSDPGAYFSYSSAGAPTGKWRMTLGNHGWSGGIYEIDDQTICRQLTDLAKQGMLGTIQLDRVCFFSHYPLESASGSKTMNQEISAIHGGSRRHVDGDRRG